MLGHLLVSLQKPEGYLEHNTQTQVVNALPSDSANTSGAAFCGTSSARSTATAAVPRRHGDWAPFVTQTERAKFEVHYPNHTKPSTIGVVSKYRTPLFV